MQKILIFDIDKMEEERSLAELRIIKTITEIIIT